MKELDSFSKKGNKKSNEYYMVDFDYSEVTSRFEIEELIKSMSNFRSRREKDNYLKDGKGLSDEDLKSIEEHNERCKECGGRCCKKCPCSFSPEDFKDLSYDGLKKELEKNYISIDCWVGDPREDSDSELEKTPYFLRVMRVNGPVVDPMEESESCKLLTESGCAFSFEERPKGGRQLIALENVCKVGYSKRQCAIDWLPYNEVLVRLVEEFKIED